MELSSTQTVDKVGAGARLQHQLCLQSAGSDALASGPFLWN